MKNVTLVPARVMATLVMLLFAAYPWTAAAQDNKKVAPAAPAAKAAPAAPAAQAYQQAYNLVLDEKWEEAADSLADFLEKYMDNSFAGAARFWQCYAEAQLGDSLENTFNCYRSFITDYPLSQWKDDAEAHMIETARKLVSAGHAEYVAFLESNQANDNIDVAFSAIMALQQTGSDLALPALIELLNSGLDGNTREQMVYLLSQFDSPEARAQLVSLAKSDPEANVREKSLFWLSQSGEVTSDDIRSMVEVVNSDDSPRVREQAVFALSQLADRQGAEVLIELARKNPDSNIRQKALFWLSQSGEVTAGDIRAIEEIIEKDADPKVREQGVFALSQLEDRQGVAALIALGRRHPDTNVRQKSMFWLSQIEEVTAGDIQAIVGIINSDTDPKVREQGVFALSQLEGRGGVEAMRELAGKHPDPNIREKAVFWLTQSDEVTAGDIQLIVDVINGDADPGVRRGGLVALSQLEEDAAVDALLKIAREHPDKEFRKQAVVFLGHSSNPRAQKALLELSKPAKK